MEPYTEKLIEHFRNPRNVGEIENPSASAQVGNPVCGDVMKIDLLIKDGRIKDIKFKTLGCAAAIATSSVLTEIAKGKKLEEAKAIGNSDIAKKLGGMPKVKLHCSVLAADCLKKAIANYETI